MVLYFLMREDVHSMRHVTVVRVPNAPMVFSLRGRDRELTGEVYRWEVLSLGTGLLLVKTRSDADAIALYLSLSTLCFLQVGREREKENVQGKAFLTRFYWALEKAWERCELVACSSYQPWDIVGERERGRIQLWFVTIETAEKGGWTATMWGRSFCPAPLHADASSSSIQTPTLSLCLPFPLPPRLPSLPHPLHCALVSSTSSNVLPAKQ